MFGAGGRIAAGSAVRNVEGVTVTFVRTYDGNIDDTKWGQILALSPTYSLITANDSPSAFGYGTMSVYTNSSGVLKYTKDNPSPVENDWFGYDGDISESYCIIGIPYDDTVGSDQGQVIVYTNSTGAVKWTKNDPNNYASTGDLFGTTVANNESYFAVGAAQEDHTGANNAGVVYVYTMSTGALLHTISNPNHYGASGFDYFGSFIAMNSTHLAVGAPGEDDVTSGEQTGWAVGVAYIISLATGGVVHTLENPNASGTTEDDGFGSAIAMSESYTVVGARDEESAGAVTSAGAAYIFDNATGALLHTLENPDGDLAGNTFANFGANVSISEKYCLVGAFSSDIDGGFNNGAAYIFSTATGELLERIDDVSGNSSYFGQDVAITDDAMIIGEYAKRKAHYYTLT